MKTPAPCGSWSSIFSAASIAAGGRKLAQPFCRHGAIWWLEGLPEEGGRLVLCRHHGGQTKRLTPADYSVRTRAQEYGGGAWCAADTETVYFINNADQGLYRQRGNKVTRVFARDGLRLGDLHWDPFRERVIAVAEDHSVEPEPATTLVAVDAHTGRLSPLVEGADFHIAPRLSPDGQTLCWVSWDHPDMPFDHARLYVAELDSEGLPGTATMVAGQSPEAVFQPTWAEDGSLWFVSDRESGWWNLWRHGEGETHPVTRESAELGLPWWQFGMQSWGFFAPGRAVSAVNEDGIWHLARIEGDRTEPLLRDWSAIAHVDAGDGQAVMLAARPDHPAAVVKLDPDSGASEILAVSAEPPGDPRWLSRAEAIRFPTGDDETAHAFFYPPRHPEQEPLAGERPPVLVKCHGGPTGATDNAYDPRIQYWTSRGIAVVDINYRGSTGFGRAYRHRLYEGWGELDVDDCVQAVRYLAEAGRVDADRALISGSSAGGYSVLAALAFTDAFAAGASYYGVSDLERLDESTHKLESRYLEKLIGPRAQNGERWKARSPIHHVDQIQAPVIFFQGDEDRVVPPEQAERMATSLRERGQPVALVIFPGEGHGFRSSECIRNALDMELSFYGRVLAFTPADATAEPEIDNL